MTAYYNELDPFKAEVLREAIRAGAIAPGDVDERSIADVQPAELVGYTQCHFFAGGGFWSLALRLAGWSDDRPVWTGSCPCPSFSAAGKGLGFADPRHLWPEWYRLIRECRPARVIGEQVAAAIGHGWLDLVCGGMEAEGYAIAAAVLGAHSAGAPHIRQRLCFGAHAASARRDGALGESESNSRDEARLRLLSADGGTGGGAEPLHPERRALDVNGCDGRDRAHGGRQEAHGQPGACGEVLSGGDTAQRGQPVCWGASGEPGHASRAGEPCLPTAFIGAHPELPSGPCCGEQCGSPLSDTEAERASVGRQPIREWRGPGWLDPLTARSVAEAGATRGFWADCDWWYGRDGKYRPIGPGLFPLASGSPARVGRLRMYGDAINVETAKEFIIAYAAALVSLKTEVAA